MEAVPMIVIPDTQAEYDMLMRLLDKLDKLGLLQGRTLGFLGDYLDRGSNARKLIDLCLELRAEGAMFIRGNHEDTLLKAVAAHLAGDEMIRDYWIFRWLRVEDNTLWSYGLSRHGKGRVALLTAFTGKLEELGHLDFLQATPYYAEHGDLILVHAGLQAGTAWQVQRQQLDADLNRIDSEPEQTYSFELADAAGHGATGKCVVSGHSRRDVPFLSESRVMLDCGASVGGPLVAWVSDTNQIVSVSPR